MAYSSKRGRLMRGGRRGKRNYKKRMVRRIDTVKSQSKSANVLSMNAPSLLGTKTVITSLVTNIAQGDSRNQRERNTAYIKGLRIRMSFRNTDDVPKWLNVALISPRDPFPTDSSTANILALSRFFKQNGTGNASGDFTTAASGLKWGTDPINTDEYNVLWHMRKRLGVRPQTVSDPFTSGVGAPNYCTLSRYMKIGKLMRWVVSAGDSCQTPIYLIWWVANFEEGTGASIANALAYQAELVTYFGDPKR